jgi:hypothetical protein
MFALRGKICAMKKRSPCHTFLAGALYGKNYFFAEQAQPQPEDFFSSCFCMVPGSVHAGHFFGLHLPSWVAPHFSHLNTAILFSFVIF